MQTIQELGLELAARRRELGLKQKDVAAKAGISAVSLSRLERGGMIEFGVGKVMMVLVVLGMEFALAEIRASRTLDDLRKERSGQ